MVFRYVVLEYFTERRIRNEENLIFGIELAVADIEITLRGYDELVHETGAATFKELNAPGKRSPFHTHLLVYEQPMEVGDLVYDVYVLVEPELVPACEHEHVETLEMDHVGSLGTQGCNGPLGERGVRAHPGNRIEGVCRDVHYVTADSLVNVPKGVRVRLRPTDEGNVEHALHGIYPLIEPRVRYKPEEVGNLSPTHPRPSIRARR